MNGHHAPSPAAGAAGSSVLYAMVRSHGRTIAIPSASVLRAVNAPPRLTPLPRRAGGIEGLLTLGRGVVPVVGLVRWLASAAAGTDREDAAIEPAHGVVLLLKHGDVCIGLAADAVLGAQRIRRDRLRRLCHDDSPDELFQSAALFDGDSAPTAILEADRLMALAGVWVSDAALEGAAAAEVTDPAIAGAASAGRAAVRSDSVAYASFRIGDAHVALPAGNVGELLRRPALRGGLLPHDGVVGLCDWRGRLVPVVDLAGALHALPAGDAPAAWVCIVCAGSLAIGIVLHDVLEIVRIAPDAGTAEDAPEAQRSVVARRLLSGPHTLQLIDVAALLRRYPEAGISTQGAQARRSTGSADAAAPAYMVFDAGGLYAARIDGVQEVINLPDELRPRLEAGNPATLQWRQQPVPVIAISDSLVALAPRAARQLIIVSRGDRLAALPIAGVKAMVPRGTAGRNRMRIQGRATEVISVDTEDHRASYPVVELCSAPRPVV